ncbi:MAG: ribonuclease E/G [Lachnospiraceae bacterium]|nr:ribonuclease E/G [Lachnospiraceae bacterium]
MRREVKEHRDMLRKEIVLKDVRYLAFRGEEDGTEKLAVLKIGGGRILRIWTQRADAILPGDVYMGRIENRKGDVGASFADIGRGETVFVPGSIKPGTELPLMIRNTAWREKRAKAVTAMPEGAEEEIARKAEHAVKGSCLLSAERLLERSVREALDTEGALWVTEDEGLYERAQKAFPGEERVRLYRDENLRMCELYGLRTKLSHVLSGRVNLSSGANIVLTETEALCVIDVNSAKAAGKKEKEESALQVNLEAADEIALQICARELGGIILVDFISMKEKESETILIKHMKEQLKLSGSGARVEDITKLGIMEITRSRSRDSIRVEKEFLNSTILTK